MDHRALSRRSFLALSAAAGAAALAACSGPEVERPEYHEDAGDPAARAGQPLASSGDAPAGDGDAPAPNVAQPEGTAAGSDGLVPTPQVGGRIPVTIAIDPEMPVALRARASAVADRIVGQLGARALAPGTTSMEEADLVVTPLTGDASEAADDPLSHVDFVAVVSRRLLVREVTFQQLQALWNGEIGDWSAVGSPVSHGVVPVTLAGSAGPFDPAKAVRDIGTYDDLASYFVAERGALAIVPIDDIDFRFRTLNLDGVNYLRPGEAANPLRMSVRVRPSGSSAQLLERVREAIAPEPGPTPVSMTWAGDIIIARQVQRRILETGDWAAPFRTIAPELTWADITISNLETSLTDSFDPILDPTTFTFSTNEAAIEGLQLAQIDVLSRANNHSFNWGVTGMEDTTRVLDQAGILHFGMGYNLEEARRAVHVEAGGVSFAFLGYNGISDDWDGATPDSAGTCPLIDWLVVEDIQREVAAGHVVIPFFHWGTEYVYDPTEEQRYFAHIAIDAGAAVVMGSHPHWVQAVETYQGRPIVYSLGNFVFDQEWSLETKQGMIAHLWMKGDRPLKIDLVPILIEDYHKPRVMEPWEQWDLLEHVWAASDWIIQNG